MLLFQFRLAKALGMTRNGKSIEDQTEEEMILWIAYQQIESLAPVDSWLQTASTNFYVDRGAGAQRKKIEDYMPLKPAKRKIMTAQEQINLIKFYMPSAYHKAQEINGQ